MYFVYFLRTISLKNLLEIKYRAIVKCYKSYLLFVAIENILVGRIFIQGTRYILHILDTILLSGGAFMFLYFLLFF